MKTQDEEAIRFNMPYKKQFSPEIQELLTAVELAQAADDSLWRKLAETLLDDMKEISRLDGKIMKSIENKSEIQKRDDDMKYEEEFKLYKLISQMADEYPELDELLESNGLTYKEALQKTNDWKEELEHLLKKLNIHDQSLVTVCRAIIKQISIEPGNADLQRAYCMIITDLGLLFPYDERTEERDIRNYLKQKDNTEKLMKSIAEQKMMKLRFENLLGAAKMKLQSSKDFSEEAEAIYKLSIRYKFLRPGQNRTVYTDNIAALLQQIHANPYLREVKPYLIGYVLSHRSGYMLNRPNFQPNLECALRPMIYNSMNKDNGKNFKSYQSSIELYMALRRYYQKDETVDIVFSDYCFANLSNLSDWYYENFEPDDDVPIKLIYKAALLKAPTFPMLPADEDGSLQKELEEQMLSVINNWIS